MPLQNLGCLFSGGPRSVGKLQPVSEAEFQFRCIPDDGRAAGGDEVFGEFLEIEGVGTKANGNCEACGFGHVLSAMRGEGSADKGDIGESPEMFEIADGVDQNQRRGEGGGVHSLSESGGLESVFLGEFRNLRNAGDVTGSEEESEIWKSAAQVLDDFEQNFLFGSMGAPRDDDLIGGRD